MPRVVNHEERRAKIAHAAARAIAEVGIDRVKMSDVAAAAGCTVGALPHYFEGKDEILAAALRAVHEAIRERATRVAVETGFDPVAVWLAILPTTPGAAGEWRVWLSFSGRGPFNEVLGAELSRRYARAHEDTCLMLRSMQTSGRLPADLDVEHASETVAAMIDGLGLRATLQPGTWPTERMRAHLEAQLRRLGWTPHTRRNTEP